MKLDIQKFIESHDNWESLLQEKPYCLSISRAKWCGLNLIMFKYNQIDSSFHESIVRECRGIIFNEDTWETVSVPFFKFGNVSEGSWVEPIDWNNDPYVLDKIDGSLIKIVKINGQLLISTNGTIDAYSAPLVDQIGCAAKNFGQLVDEAVVNAYKANHNVEGFVNPVEVDNWLYYLLDEGYTYMFELTSPWNRVVVNHHDTKLWFIGVRNNTTFEESFILDHPLSKVFDTPGLHKFSTFEECIDTAKKLPWCEEGYVVTTKDFKRNKVKSLEYLNCHHLKNNGVMSISRAIGIVQAGEIDEIVAYFPEFKDGLIEVKCRYETLMSTVENDLARLSEALSFNEGWTRKDIAQYVLNTFKVPSVGFMFVDKKIENVDDWISKCQTPFLVKILGYKDDE